MNRFLWGGGGFQNIVRDFGRPAVRHWTGVALEHGAAAYGPAAPRDPPARARSGLGRPGAIRRGCRGRDVHRARSASSALAVDPQPWELIRFTLWDLGAEADGDRYEVLHLSTPALAGIGTGRHW